MPSAKPDSNEVYSLRKKRGFNEVERSAELYVGLHAQCIAATSEGYITRDRASLLLQFLKAKPHVAAIYPNNVLARLLNDICSDGGWNSEFEHDLLNLIYALYLGYEPTNRRAVGRDVTATIGMFGVTITSQASRSEPRPPGDLAFALSDAKFQSVHLKTALLSEHVDSLTTLPDLRDRFVGFTGKFQYGSRAVCFSEARSRGAVPCDPALYMDYFFVSSEFEKRGSISNKLDAAIFHRRVYGRPLILGEQSWNSIVNNG